MHYILRNCSRSICLVTTDEARDFGIPTIELVKLAHRGKLKHLGNGLYRLSRYLSTSFDAYAEAVKRVGTGACLFGESVLAFHNLVPTNPSFIYVASPMRIRKKLPGHIRVIKRHIADDKVYYEGIPSQTVGCAIRSCMSSIMKERLIDAIHEARRIGIITNSEATKLTQELVNDRKTTEQ